MRDNPKEIFTPDTHEVVNLVNAVKALQKRIEQMEQDREVEGEEFYSLQQAFEKFARDHEAKQSEQEIQLRTIAVEVAVTLKVPDTLLFADKVYQWLSGKGIPPQQGSTH